MQGGSVEPTNEQLASGGWAQPPAIANQIVVKVPDGVYAKLKQAREMYVELTEEQVEAYDSLSVDKFDGGDYAKNGDMSPEAAVRLATAMSSKVFDKIEALVMSASVHDKIAYMLIGTIETAGRDRYFQIDVPQVEPADIVKLTKSVRRKEWWGDGYNVATFALIAISILIVITVLIGWMVTGDAWMLMWLLTVPAVWFAYAMVVGWSLGISSKRSCWDPFVGFWRSAFKLPG